MKPIHKFNNSRGATLCYKCSVIISEGMTKEKYHELLEEQNNGCRICGATEAKHRSSNNLLVDHCHVTGKCRGLLCNRCNTSLGFVNDDIELLEKMVNYLKEYKQ